MVGAKWIRTKVLIKTNRLQTHLIIRLFCLVFVFFSTEQKLYSQQAPLKYLGSIELAPQKLRLEKDSIRFLISGKLAIGSGLLTKQPEVRLRLLAKEDSLDLGKVVLNNQTGITTLQKKVSLYFQPWMEGASLLLDFLPGKNKPPVETKILAKGVHAPQLLVRFGHYLPGETVPRVGRYDFPEKSVEAIPHTKAIYFRFEPGKSDWLGDSENQKVKMELMKFLEQNPEIVSLKITGLQSPEQAEGRTSQLGYRRAEQMGQKLLEFFPGISKDQINLQSRWNDWLDFSVLLSDNKDIPEQTKARYYKELDAEGTYLEKGLRIKAMPDYERVAAAIFPKLRSALVELTAKPVVGLNRQKKNLLRESLAAGGKNKLSYTDWELAAASTSSLDEKAFLYASMIKWFASPAPFINLAVVRMRQGQELEDNESRAVLWEEAARLLEAANQLQVTPLGLYNEGQLKVLRGEFWEAYKILSEASVLAKEDDSLSHAIESLRGALDVQRGDYKLALLRFGYPMVSAEDWFNKGLAYCLIGDYQGANTAFEASVLAKREFGYGYYGLALVAMELGQLESAHFYFEKAITANIGLKQKIAIDPIFSQFFD